MTTTTTTSTTTPTTKAAADAATEEQRRRMEDRQHQAWIEVHQKRLRNWAENHLANQFLAIVDKHTRELKRLAAIQEQTFPSASKTLAQLLNFDDDDDTNRLLTGKELRTLKQETYQSWFAGAMGAFAGFGLVALIGTRAHRRDLQKVARRTLATPNTALKELDRRQRPNRKHLLNTATASETTNNKLPSLRNAGGAVAVTTTRQKKKKAKPKKDLDPKTKEANDAYAWSTLQGSIEFIMAGAVAIVTGVVSSFLFADIESYHRNLAQLPLHRGKSHLCHRACPELLQKHAALMRPRRRRTLVGSSSSSGQEEEDTYEWVLALDPPTMQQGLEALDETTTTRKTKKQNANADENDEASASRRQQELLQKFMNSELMQDMPSDQDLWENPSTPLLETITQLVTNCRQRQQYIRDLKLRQQRAPATLDNHLLLLLDSDGEPYDVPFPGVPRTYLGVDATTGEAPVIVEDLLVFDDKGKTDDDSSRRWWFW